MPSTPKSKSSNRKSLWIGLGALLALVAVFFVARAIIDQSGPLKDSVPISSIQEIDFQTIRMDVVRTGWQPDSFILKKDVLVKWIINGKDLTNCNSAIDVPDLNLHFQIKQGEQTIEFTPHQSGEIKWSCWMGMIDGKFIVE